jgi:hypothetical protein
MGVILALLALDAALNDSAASLFLARKIMGLALYLTFWRH